MKKYIGLTQIILRELNNGFILKKPQLPIIDYCPLYIPCIWTMYYLLRLGFFLDICGWGGGGWRGLRQSPSPLRNFYTTNSYTIKLGTDVPHHKMNKMTSLFFWWHHQFFCDVTQLVILEQQSQCYSNWIPSCCLSFLEL